MVRYKNILDIEKKIPIICRATFCIISVNKQILKKKLNDLLLEDLQKYFAEKTIDD